MCVTYVHGNYKEIESVSLSNSLTEGCILLFKHVINRVPSCMHG